MRLEPAPPAPGGCRQLHDQARQQTSHLGDAIQDLGHKLHALAEGRTDETGQVGDYTSGDGVLRAGPAVKYAWIDDMDARQLWWFSITLGCELLEVSRSGFYDWRARRQRPATER